MWLVQSDLEDLWQKRQQEMLREAQQAHLAAAVAAAEAAARSSRREAQRRLWQMPARWLGQMIAFLTGPATRSNSPYV